MKKTKTGVKFELSHDELQVLDWVLNSGNTPREYHERAAEESGVENHLSVLQMVRGKARVALYAWENP